MQYNKLVRDRIPDIIAESGKEVTFRILDDEEFKIELEKKLNEEVAEFNESKSLEELVDIYDVLITLIVVSGYTCKQFMKALKAKNKARGGLTKGIFLEEVKDD